MKWGLLGMAAAGLGLVCDYMSNKEENEAKDQEIEELKRRVKNLESKIYENVIQEPFEFPTNKFNTLLGIKEANKNE